MDTRLVAVHEAAHAVVAAALGHEVVSVTVIPSETFLGCCTIGPSGAEPGSEEWDRWSRANLFVDVSGEVAVARVTGEPTDWGEFGEVEGSDIDFVIDELFRLDDEDISPKLHRAERGARLLLHRHWHRVERLAAALEKDGTLNGTPLTEHFTGLGRLGVRSRLRAEELDAAALFSSLRSEQPSQFAAGIRAWLADELEAGTDL